jgi:hypothetical protein
MSKFQYFIIWKHKANTPGLTPFSHSEQVKGEIALKDWETNMEEGKKLSRDAKEACLEALSSVNKKLIEFEGNNINQIDLIKINELLVNPSLQYQITVQEVNKIQENFPLMEKNMFAFELNERIEPSIFVVALMDMCTQFNEQRKASVVGRK